MRKNNRSLTHYLFVALRFRRFRKVYGRKTVHILPSEYRLSLLIKLAYLHGKGQTFVPVLVPLDCERAIEILVEKRTENGIMAENSFVFASRGECVCVRAYVCVTYSI